MRWVSDRETQGPATFTPTTGIQPVPDPLASVPAPACSAGNPANIGDFSGSGTIYAKSAPVTLIGNAAMNGFDALIVCDTYTLRGNAGVTDNYVATDNYEPPAPPTLSE